MQSFSIGSSDLTFDVVSAGADLISSMYLFHTGSQQQSAGGGSFKQQPSLRNTLLSFFSSRTSSFSFFNSGEMVFSNIICSSTRTVAMESDCSVVGKAISWVVS